MKQSRLAAGVTVLLAAASPVASQTRGLLDVPNVVPFQGMLTQPSGVPLPDGPHTLRFVLFNGPTPTVPVTGEPAGFEPGDTEISLSHFPVVGSSVVITSRTETVPASAYTVNEGSGRITRTSPGAIPDFTTLRIDYVYHASALWAEVQAGVLTTGGRFSVLLGSTAAIPPAALTTESHLQVEVDADNTGNFEVLQPRMRLGSSATALVARRLPALRVELPRPALGNDFETAPNIIGGSELNSTDFDIIGATISGGGSPALRNQVRGHFGTVGGGLGNRVSSGNVLAPAFAGTVAGGENNAAGGAYASVGGGQNNIALARHSIVPGGQDNLARGIASFAAGRGAEALHNNTFVWGDGSSVDPFASTAANQFLIRAAGGVGIGTGDPHNAVHIRKASAGNVTGHVNAPLIIENGTSAFIHFLTPAANENGLLFGSPNAAIGGGILFNPTAVPGGFQFRAGGNTTRMVVTSTGAVGIGTITPTAGFKLDVAGHIRAEGVTQTSSARLKQNIRPLSDALSTVLRLEGKRYDWKASGRYDIGLIAEDVARVVPEVVSLGEDGEAQGIDYGHLNALTIQAIKEQQAQIERLRRENEALRGEAAKVRALEERLERLEQAANPPERGAR